MGWPSWGITLLRVIYDMRGNGSSDAHPGSSAISHRMKNKEVQLRKAGAVLGRPGREDPPLGLPPPTHLDNFQIILTTYEFGLRFKERRAEKSLHFYQGRKTKINKEIKKHPVEEGPPRGAS